MRKITLSFICLLLGIWGHAQTSGGPDAYGYVWYDSNDPSGPTYNWIDITAVGTQALGLTDDNSIGSFPMTSFQYYWNTVDEIKIGSNGWLSFNNTISNIAHCFPSMPTAGGVGDNFIAPFMSDLIFNGAGNPAQLWYYDDIANDRFIVSYINVPWWTASAPGYIGSNTFQVILSRTDSSITYQYADVDQTNFNNTGGCSNEIVIGIENSTGNIGLLHSLEIVPTDNYAIKFEYPNPVLFAIQDPAVTANQNPGSKGAFYVITDNIPISTTITNSGNTDVSTDIEVNVQLNNLFAVNVYDENDTITGGLNSGNSSTLNMPSTTLVAGQYTMTSTSTNSSDINPSNNTLSSEINVVDISSNPITMSYATQNNPDGSLSWSGTNKDGAGVYHEPPSFPVTLDCVGVFMSNTALSGTPAKYYIGVYDDDGAGGAPGTLLQIDSTFSASFSNNWEYVSLTNPVIITSGGVYIGWFSADSCALGTETSGPISRQSWEYLGGWSPYRNNNNTEFLINGYYSSSCGSLTTSVSPSNVTCNGANDGTINLTVTGGTAGFSYVWTNGAGTGEDPSGLAPGKYVVTVTDTNGCTAKDSATLIEPVAITGTLTQSICEGGSIIVNGNPYDSTVVGATEVFVAGAANGCDSIVTINLTVLPRAATTISDTICTGDSIVVNGTAYTTSVTGATETFNNAAANGCDSIVTINLTVNDIDNSVTTNGVVLTASQGGSTYQWVDCNNGNTDIAGATNQSYTATTSGSYAVTITMDNCTKMSACTNITLDGIEELSRGVNLYPNPASESVVLELGDMKNVSIDILNIAGQVVYSSVGNNNGTTEISLSDMEKGIYFVKVKTSNTQRVIKLVKE